MSAPLFVRPLTPEERQALETGLRSPDAFVVRRCQALLKSAAGYTPGQIHAQLGWSDQSVRRYIRAFDQEGLACLQPKSKRPQRVQPRLDAAAREQLRTWLRQSPRDFGLPTSRWTLDGLATVCFARGLTPQRVSRETIRQAVLRLGLSWQRAKRWLEAADPAYARKKGREIGCSAGQRAGRNGK